MDTALYIIPELVIIIYFYIRYYTHRLNGTIVLNAHKNHFYFF